MALRRACPRKDRISGATMRVFGTTRLDAEGFAGSGLPQIVDVISIGYDVYDIYNNGLNWENGLSLAADVASLAIPFVAGSGLAVRAVTKADDVLDVVTHADEAFDVVKYTDDVADAASHADDVGDIGKQLYNAPCPFNSFSAETPVMTARGARPISELLEGDLVLAWDEATGKNGYFVVSDMISHVDPKILLLTINSEILKTTADHPFYVVEGNEWLPLSRQGDWIAPTRSLPLLCGRPACYGTQSLA